MALIKNRKLFISLFCSFLAILTFFLFLMPAYIYPRLTLKTYIPLNGIDSIDALFQDNKETVSKLDIDITELPNNFYFQEIISQYLLTRFTEKEFLDYYVNKTFELFLDKEKDMLEVKSISFGRKASIELNDFLSGAIISYLDSEAEKKYMATLGIIENKIILLEDSKNKYKEEAKAQISSDKINQLNKNIEAADSEIKKTISIKDSLAANKNLIVNRFFASKVLIFKEQYISAGKYIFLIAFGSFLFSLFITFLIDYYKNNIFKSIK